MTREDIQNRKFNVVKKGYDVVQVDTFLDEIAEFAGAVSADAEELEKFRGMEKQLSSALITAQSMGNTIKDNAEKEAEEKIAAAEEQADQIIADAKAEGENQIAELKAQKEALEAENAQLLEKIASIKEFVETYKQCVIMDIDNHKEAFLQGFISEATLEQSDIELEPEEEELVEVEAEEEVEVPEEAEELDTGDMETIDLSEIVNNLPNADDELKKLIDDIL